MQYLIIVGCHPTVIQIGLTYCFLRRSEDQSSIHAYIYIYILRHIYIYIYLISTQSQSHVEELIGGQSWGVLEVQQIDIPENESLSFFGGSTKIQVQASLKQPRY